MISIKKIHWCLRTTEEDLVKEIAQHLNISEMVARILSHRVDIDALFDFADPKLKNLMPDPHMLNNMDRALERCQQAITHQETIGIFGDYDVDGATSTALLLRYFRQLNQPATFYIPDRQKEGYGPNQAALDTLKAKGCTLIIMVDCGTTAVAPVAYGNSIGLDIIILDHHLPESTLAPAYAIVNPQTQPSIRTDMTYLCAAGIVFLFLVGLTRQLKRKHNLLEELDLVALATVCDIVPLKGLNRALVKQGLKIASLKQNIGMRSLCEIAQVKDRVTPYHMGFCLGPRINAGGRVGNAHLGTQILFADDPEQALRLAQMLDDFNQQRKDIEKKILDEAIAYVYRHNLIQRKVILLGEKHWHSGVIGIVASKIKDLFQKPCFVASFMTDIGQGSARSFDNIPVGPLLHKACQANILESGGGHKCAGGFKMHQTRFEDFYAFLENEVPDSGVATNTIDIQLPVSALTKGLLEQFTMLEPYGQGNAEPLILVRDVTIQYPVVLKEAHIRCVLRDHFGHSVPAIAFNAFRYGLNHALMDGSSLWHVIGHLRLNDWNNKVNFHIVDLCFIIP